MSVDVKIHGMPMGPAQQINSKVRLPSRELNKVKSGS
jgi:hypothetical protein